MNDPLLWGMNSTQVLAELEHLHIEKERREDELLIIGKFVRNAMVNMLGLNLMPIEDPETGLFRRPNENEIIPLVAMIGNSELLKVMSERHDALLEQEKLEEEGIPVGEDIQEMSPEELDDYLNEDLQFVSDEELEKRLVWNDPHTQNLIKQVVKIREDAENTNNTGQVKDSGKSNVIIESEEASAPPTEGGRVKLDKSD